MRVLVLEEAMLDLHKMVKSQKRGVSLRMVTKPNQNKKYEMVLKSSVYEVSLRADLHTHSLSKP